MLGLYADGAGILVHLGCKQFNIRARPRSYPSIDRPAGDRYHELGGVFLLFLLDYCVFLRVTRREQPLGIQAEWAIRASDGDWLNCWRARRTASLDASPH